MPAGLALHAQEAVLEHSALQVVLELTLHETRQQRALPGQMIQEPGVMGLDDLVERRLLGSMALIGNCPQKPGGWLGVHRA